MQLHGAPLCVSITLIVRGMSSSSLLSHVWNGKLNHVRYEIADSHTDTHTHTLACTALFAYKHICMLLRGQCDIGGIWNGIFCIHFMDIPQVLSYKNEQTNKRTTLVFSFV